MTSKLFLVAAALVGGLSSVRSQAPIPWPLSCPIPSTVANNTTSQLPYQPCWPVVTDANGQIVSMGLCLQVIAFLEPGDTFTTHWGQYDFSGQPVPAGIYFVNGVAYDVGAVDIALQPLGPPHPGATRDIELCAPSQPNAPYVMAAAFSSTTGTMLGCGLTLPLDPDPLLAASVSNPVLFPNFLGNLDASGRTTDPGITLPANQALVGLPLELAALTLDPSAPCGIGLISAATSSTVQ